MSQLHIDFSRPYYNTTNLKGSVLVKEVENAQNQDQRILQLFRTYFSLTPSEALKYYNEKYPAIPITSCRRSITNLTKNNYLIMTDTMQPGLYNKPEHLWRVK